MKKALLALAALIVVAAVLVPSLLRARVGSSGESPVIGDTRALISAMSAYQSLNGGFSEGRLECLADPAPCLRGYKPGDPTFLDPLLARRSRKRTSGEIEYLVTFVPGPAVAAEAVERAKASRTSVQCWASVAVALAEGARSFCGDCSGRVCSYRDGRQPPLLPDGSCGSRGSDGSLRPTCETIQ